MSNGPIEPRADFRIAGRELFQYFTALTIEGFTERQALTILGHVLAAVAQQGGGDA